MHTHSKRPTILVSYFLKALLFLFPLETKLHSTHCALCVLYTIHCIVYAPPFYFNEENRFRSDFSFLFFFFNYNVPGWLYYCIGFDLFSQQSPIGRRNRCRRLILSSLSLDKVGGEIKTKIRTIEKEEGNNETHHVEDDWKRFTNWTEIYYRSYMLYTLSCCILAEDQYNETRESRIAGGLHVYKYIHAWIQRWSSSKKKPARCQL